jgi:hypothetical protein
MTFAKEIKGSWFGVTIPDYLRAFDCRGDETPVTSWGHTLFGSDKAGVDLGLRKENESFSTTPISCSTYVDARTANDAELARQVKNMLGAVDALKLRYEDAVAHPAPKGQGGGAEYLPVAIEMSNFGWSVIADKRIYAIKSYNP